MAESHIWESKNKLWPQYLASFSGKSKFSCVIYQIFFVALLAMFCAGIHLGWPSPFIPRVLSDEYPLNVTIEEASYIAVIGPLGDLAGNIVSSVLVDTIGRKYAILLIALPQMTSMVMIFLSEHSVILLYAARFIGGISEGACFTILPIYICEVSEPKIRGILGALLTTSIMLGTLFVNLVGSYVTIATSALIFLACSIIFLLLFSFMPESPYYLLMKKHTEKARKSLKRLRGNQNVDQELSSLAKDVQRQMSESGRFVDLYKIKSNKIATIVMIILRLLQQLSGNSSFTMYAQILFKDATDAIPEHWAAILMLVIQTIFNVVAVIIVDIVGRKPLVLTSIGGCCVTLAICGLFFTIRDFTSIDVSSLNVLILVVLMMVMMFFAIGLSSVVNLMLGELFPASIKAKALCVMNMVMSLSMFASTKFYQYTADNVSLAVPFWVFALSQLIGFIFCCTYVPETMNKTLEQIQQELKLR